MQTRNSLSRRRRRTFTFFTLGIFFVCLHGKWKIEGIVIVDSVQEGITRRALFSSNCSAPNRLENRRLPSNERTKEWKKERRKNLFRNESPARIRALGNYRMDISCSTWLLFNLFGFILLSKSTFLWIFFYFGKVADFWWIKNLLHIFFFYDIQLNSV